MQSKRVLSGLLSFVLLTALPTPPAAHAQSRPSVEAAHGMVVTSQRIASQVGVDILKAGGNAIDAAVAVGYAQAVVNPCCGNIGGGGFMTIHLADGHDTFIDFRETAPSAASASMYLDAEGNVKPGASLHGYGAVAVPGTVKGLDLALRKYGRLPRAQVMAPAIHLARDGFVLTRADTDIIDTSTDELRKDRAAARIFLRPDGSPLRPGDRLVQRDLANTLEAIANRGPDAFYRGRIPRIVETASRAGGGYLTAADFADYRAIETAPVTCRYRGYTFVSAPPPSSGGTTLCETLGVLSGYDLQSFGWHSAASIHYLTEALRRAYADRNTELGDPAFVHNPIDRLLSPGYAQALRASISPDRATPSDQIGPPQTLHESPQTTHYSIVDHDGNAVSTTYTIDSRFGAGVMPPGTGFLLNDEMDDFTAKPGVKNMFGLVQGESNAIAPGKRPLSSMAPTIVTRDGNVFLVLGSPGGSRIISTTLETELDIIDYGMAPQQAVDAPRVHHQWLPDEVDYEPFAISPDTLKLLKDMGYKMVEQAPWGAVELIEVGMPRAATPALTTGNDSAVVDPERVGYFYGASDDRRPAGAAIGY